MCGGNGQFRTKGKKYDEYNKVLQNKTICRFCPKVRKVREVHKLSV